MSHPNESLTRTSRAVHLGVCGLAAVVLATACGASSTAAGPATATGTGPAAASDGPTARTGFPMTVRADGRTLTFASPPRVLVDQYEAVYPVAAAGGNATGQVVAVAHDANEPIGPPAATLHGVRRLSTMATTSKEVIIGAGPNLVITHGLDTGLADQLAPLGIKTIVVNTCWDGYAAAHGGTTGYDAIYDDITMFGQLLRTSTYAAASVAALKTIVAEVAAKAGKVRKGTIAVTAGIFSGDFFTYGPPSIANTMVNTLGLTNAFSDLTKRGDSISPEELVSRDPDYIVLGYDPGAGSGGAAAALRQAMAVPGFAGLKAVTNHHVLVLSDSFLLGRAVEGLQKMYDAFAPA